MQRLLEREPAAPAVLQHRLAGRLSSPGTRIHSNCAPLLKVTPETRPPWVDSEVRVADICPSTLLANADGDQRVAASGAAPLGPVIARVFDHAGSVISIAQCQLEGWVVSGSCTMRTCLARLRPVRQWAAPRRPETGTSSLQGLIRGLPCKRRKCRRVAVSRTGRLRGSCRRLTARSGACLLPRGRWDMPGLTGLRVMLALACCGCSR
jgi:hypothetical protein